MEDIKKQIENYALRLSDLKPGFDRQEEEYYQANKVRIYDLVKQVIKSDLAKQYWQQKMYSEEEVKELLIKCLAHTNIDILGKEFDNWFSKNKKK